MKKKLQALSMAIKQLSVQQSGYAKPAALYPYTMDAYTVLDLMAAYKFKVIQQAAKVQINVTNVTDERYYPGSYGDKNRISQGEPRMIMGSVQMTF